MSIKHFVYWSRGRADLSDPADVGGYDAEPGEVRVTTTDKDEHWFYATADRGQISYRIHESGALALVVGEAEERVYGPTAWQMVEHSVHGQFWEGSGQDGPTA